MYLIRKKYRVEYAHQLKSAFSKVCSDTIHGHSGTIEIFIASYELDENRMVIDFGEISSLIKNYIMETYDHALFIPKTFSKTYINCLRKYNKKLRISEQNPTAEYFCEILFNDILSLLKPIFSEINYKRKVNYEIRLQKIRFHETETGYAEYTRWTD